MHIDTAFHHGILVFFWLKCQDIFYENNDDNFLYIQFHHCFQCLHKLYNQICDLERLQAVLKFSKGANKKEFETNKPKILDTVNSLLNTKRPEDLLKREGKEYLKAEIKDSVNAFLVDGKVVDVYYTSFQIN